MAIYSLKCRIMTILVTLFLSFVLNNQWMQMSSGKVQEIIAELLRADRSLKAKIIDIYGFRVSWVLAVKSVIGEIIANLMYEQILCKVKGINLPYGEKLMPNTAYSVL